MHIALAIASLQEKDPSGALMALKDAEAEDSKVPELHYTRSLAFYVKGDMNAALTAAKKALEYRPDYGDAMNAVGKLLLDQGRYDEAIPYLTKAAENPLFRESFQSMTNLGVLHYKRGELRKAEVYLDRAIAASPDRSCVAHYYRGHLRLKESRFKEATRDYDQATRRFCAAFADAHFAYGIALEYSKQYDKARKKYLEIQSRYPETEVAEKALTRLRALP
jgi:Tfp pilus assembly protein PilF